jgi:propanediol dehydratase small subunit
MKRLLVSGMLAAGLVVGVGVGGGVGVASAQPSDEVTITLSPEQVANLCEKRLPRIEKRAARLLERINGGADVRGSAEWLKARAAKERDAGRETSAQVFEERAERRLGKVDKLNQVTTWVTDFQSQHCEAK